jgi:ABC-type bacteriocin/lantibiotic exporter with double-glycine peptidase domain/CRP-like cAMP-binding protein
MSAPEVARAGRERIGSLPILGLLPEEQRELVIESFELRTYAFGESIVLAGEAADAFFIVVEGLVRVVGAGAGGEEVSLNILRPGDTFGEGALVNEGARQATVRASGAVTVARLDGSVVQALTRLYPDVEKAFKLQARARRLQSFLLLDSAFSVLGPDAVATMLRAAADRRVKAGEVVTREGDASDRWWIVEAGRLTVFAGEADGRRDIRFLRTGDFFGELALLHGSPRTASIEAASDTLLIELPAATFHELLRDHDDFRARIDERVALYARGPAARPLDFAHDDAGAPAAAAADEPAREVDDGLRAVADAKLDETPVEGGWTAPKRFPFVRQIDGFDCGAACVAMLCRAFGHKVSLPFIRLAVGTGQDGTSLRGIQRGGADAGLQVRALKASLDNLDTLPLPAILHWEGNHWIVLHEVGERHVRVADPARGLRKLPREEVGDKWSGYVATARPTPALADAPRDTVSLSWILPFVRPLRRTLIFAIALAILATGGEMVPPILTQSVVDAVIDGKGVGEVSAIVGVMVAVLLVSLGLSLWQRRTLARAAVQLDSDTLDFIAGRLLKLPLSYFESRRTADIERRLNGLRQVRQLLVQDCVRGLTGLIQLLVTLVILFTYSWVIGLAFLATMPIYGLLMRFSSKRLRPTFDGLEEAYARQGAKQLDAIKGIEAVKSAGAEEGVQRGMLDEFQRLANRVFQGDFLVMAYDAAIQLATFGLFVLFLWIGAVLVVLGDLSVGQLVAINALVLLANGPIVVLLGLWDQAQHASVLLQRLQDVLEHEPEQADDRARLKPVPALAGHISLRRMSFAYPSVPDRPILTDVSLELEPGMTLGLVGRSGSGKSSLVRCLAGMLVPGGGSIHYDGVDLRELSWVELRRRIGFVLQQPYLFDDTIAANIALGEAEPDLDRVRRAADVADAAGFIDALALGYETKVGDSGLRVSGGQAQRIAIARALYHEPPVLLFDEATSALDTESERAVKENLDRVLEQRTAVVIAHRISTIRDADLIGVLEQGRLAELGTHEQLMEREGLYHYLNTVQLAP